MAKGLIGFVSSFQFEDVLFDGAHIIFHFDKAFVNFVEKIQLF